ncbi:hypothetical protein L202_00974 [Cryptococcus amylolentus CBS 6039]|uniref:Uncharacterized protein n=1 Tax=Cryptococcus amylolentus CBS 6039 TaxID=1295533 RepID=A0A1E3I4E9_9TREE|nr:hypothetical protein L202_00974 [Cryptococcus amylolentus CBS 6039]ODN82681.1 hypothetical protein L202_00974 [Cryptococcus amylolentus CBS 6039]
MLYAIRELGPMLGMISHWERGHHKPRRWVPDATFNWGEPLDPCTVFYQECEHKFTMAIPSTFISVAKLVLKRHEEGINKVWWDAWWIVRPDMRRYFRINFGVRYEYLPVQEEDIYLRMNYPDGRQVVESDTAYRNFPNFEPLDPWSCQEVASNFYAQAYDRQPDSVRAASSSPASSSSVSSLRTVIGDSSIASTKTLKYNKETDEGASIPTPAFVPRIITVHGWSLVHANPVEANRHWAVNTYLRDHIRPYIPEAQLVWFDSHRAESAG